MVYYILIDDVVEKAELYLLPIGSFYEIICNYLY